MKTESQRSNLASRSKKTVFFQVIVSWINYLYVLRELRIIKCIFPLGLVLYISFMYRKWNPVHRCLSGNQGGRFTNRFTDNAVTLLPSFICHGLRCKGQSLFRNELRATWNNNNNKKNPPLQKWNSANYVIHLLSFREWICACSRRKLLDSSGHAIRIHKRKMIIY